MHTYICIAYVHMQYSAGLHIHQLISRLFLASSGPPSAKGEILSSNDQALARLGHVFFVTIEKLFPFL